MNFDSNSYYHIHIINFEKEEEEENLFANK